MFPCKSLYSTNISKTFQGSRSYNGCYILIVIFVGVLLQDVKLRKKREASWAYDVIAYDVLENH